MPADKTTPRVFPVNLTTGECESISTGGFELSAESGLGDALVKAGEMTSRGHRQTYVLVIINKDVGP